MSRDASDLRFVAANTLKNAQLESTENEFDNSMNSIHFPPPRTPLNTIPDPSQFQREFQELDFDSKDRFGAARAGRSSDRKIEVLENLLSLNKVLGNVSNCGTPRVSGRGKAQSEPSSAQSTPARSISRTLNGGVVGACSGHRPPPYSVGKGGSSSRVSRGISNPMSEPLVEVPHFEIVEDPSFWMDHNVQVLIRIRPISSVERASQGYGRCLRQESSQTILWLGHPETRFTFDHIACEKISQEKLFRVAGLPMVENCISGYNSCMFAYGQTGSGKTYTMMGEIYEMDRELNEDCGITPRIFEYLFTRIRAEEENRRDEKLKYSCKCSFLEIYNEQITDLLEPSSTNLQLREDMKKGVYVENLTEYHVRTVGDIVKLLLQGAANRKMAATCMNSESSRSHSVFTCNIESHWEKDSMTHFRFARLNLVDLAGSERQKSSGAEGDRLKEAANINKSLSTLGLVIMSLVDLAHGKHRHVPYRDSRLTFLLQDSLGGNSKTTIIANVSPSTCSASETLSTLKFAQRAKLIQNNAKVNEDASGDVTALQRQIQQLKGQLSFLMNHHNLSRPLSRCLTSFGESRSGDFSEGYNSLEERIMINNHNTSAQNNKKMKCMEAALAGALRREKLAEDAVRRLEAEIECMNRLAHQREEDVQRTKMMLRFREEKIKRLELLSDGSMSADKYLMEENNALLEEVQLLQSRIERNPELTRFALENIRLLEQLRLFQNFYEQGERDALLAEVSGLRDQLLETLEGQLNFASAKENQDMDTVMELEDCKKMNSKLIREVDELHAELRKCLTCSQSASDSVTVSLSKDPEDLKQADKYSLVETISVRSDSGEEVASYDQVEDEVLQKKNTQKVDDASVMQHTDIEKELRDARMLIEAMESEQLRLIEELQFMQEENRRCMEMLSNKAKVEESVKLEIPCLETSDSEIQNMDLMNNLQVKLDRMTKDLENVKLKNNQYQEDWASQLCHEQQVELVREQVETETTRTILHLQEEVAALQLELHEKLCSMTEENLGLRNSLDAKENELRTLCGEWERATLELTNFLVDGSKSLKDASGQIESIASSFPRVNVWISEHVEKAAKVCIEKEETILLLQKSLEDAQKMAGEMELKLSSLKGATIALTEIQRVHNDESGKEAIQSSKLLDEKINMVKILESKLKKKEVQITEAENRANAAFLVVKKLSDHQHIALRSNIERDMDMSESALSPIMCSHQTSEVKTEADSLAWEEMEVQVQVARLGVLESENVINATYSDTELYLTALQTDILEASSLYRELVQDLMKDIDEMRKNFLELKEDCKNFQVHTVESEAHIPQLPNQYLMLHQIRDELDETNGRLDSIKDCISTTLNVHGCSIAGLDLIEAGGWSPDCYTSSNYHSSDASKDELDGKITEQNLNLKFEGGKILPSVNQTPEESNKLLENSIHREATIWWLRKELEMVFNVFNKLYVQLATLFNEKEIGNCSYMEDTCFLESLAPADNNQDTVLRKAIDEIKMEGMKQVFPSCKLRMKEAETSCSSIREAAADQIISHASRFLTKFEEAHTTIKEADFMLNALLKENENAKQVTVMWKQAGEEWLVEKASLIKEVEQLKSLIQLKEGENTVLQDHIHCSLVEMGDSMFFLEGFFLQMQKDVEERFRELYTAIISTGREILYSICNSRTSLEDIYSEIVEKEFALFVLYHCYIGEDFKRIIPGLNADHGFLRFGRQECNLVMNNLQKSCSSDEGNSMINGIEGIEEGDQSVAARDLEAELGQTSENLIYENLSLKKELERKEVLLKGLLFDFSLLQESASNKKDIKDETEKLILALSQVRCELEMKTSQLDDLLVQHRKLEGHLADTENALFISISDLEQAQESLDNLSDQNAELRVLLKDLYIKKSETEDQLEEQKDVIKGLEKEILRLTSSVEKKLMSSVEDIEDKLSRITDERDGLHEEVCSLKDKLEMAYALADENEAIAVEARQESEASKIYAEQKEEEVKILEHSVEELECTINVLEKKVCEMDEEVERHRLIRNSLELELQALRQRMLTVESFTENTNVEQTEDQLSRQLYNISRELNEAHTRIRILEEERAERDKEIKQYKDYISELVLHAEAQASQYQQKYKTLEAMVREVKTDSSNSVSAALVQEKTEKSTMRTRGSSSPFRCIAGLVQQMNMEKDQELSMARLHIEELEELAANRQKEVCMLNTRLAAADSMTHDVIRDLLGVKLDMTNYADLIDQHQVLKLLEEAQQQTEESFAKEQEIRNLKKQIDDLIEERESCILEINSKKADIFAAQMTVEQLQERDHLLTAQNEMLKMDKTNLKRKIIELDEMVKKLFGTQNSQQKIPQSMKIKESGSLRLGDAGITKRLANSEKLLSRVNDELAQYRRRTDEHSSYTKYRKQKGPI